MIDNKRFVIKKMKTLDIINYGFQWKACFFSDFFIDRQFHELKNLSEGVADVHIETAFELSDEELKGLLDKLASKFPGVKLTPIVRVNPELIGGVAVTVGDQVIDATVRTRLEQMKTMLTA